jgi:putative transcriptional regulator
MLAGSILLAQPGMADPHFRRTVVLLSAHTESGAIGLVINRPSGETIGSLQPEFVGGPLADVPVYDGGPVQTDRLILAAWQLLPEQSTFKLFFGLEPARVLELQHLYRGLDVRAYRGYAGWSKGQLEEEIGRDDWIVQPVNPLALQEFAETALWRELVGSVSPRFRLMAGTPDDPTVN